VKHPDWPELEAEILAKEEELWQKYGIE